MSQIGDVVCLKCEICGEPADAVWSGDKSVRCAKHYTDEVRDILARDEYCENSVVARRENADATVD